MLYEEGVTLTLEADVGTTLDAWTDISPVVVVGLVPLSEAATQISEIGFTHCSKRPFLLKVNGWVSYKTDY